MNASSRYPRGRRFTLLIGMLLHLLGAAAIPFHVWAPADPFVSGSAVAERPDDGSSLPAHDELHCVLCQAAGTLALPPSGADLLLAEADRRVETPAPWHALPPRSASPAQARAPPHA